MDGWYFRGSGRPICGTLKIMRGSRFLSDTSLRVLKLEIPSSVHVFDSPPATWTIIITTQSTLAQATR